MHGAVRRSFAIAGLTGLLVLGGGAAYAEDPLPPDQTNITVDCGLPIDDGNLPPVDQGIAVGEPAPGSVDPAKPDPAVDPAKTDPAAPPSDTQTVGIPVEELPVDPDAVACIAAGMPTGGVPPVADSSSGGSAAGGEEVLQATGQLPMTGPAPVLPTLAAGSWLLLLGVLAALAGRRRTAKI